MDATMNGITPVMPLGNNDGFGGSGAFFWVFALLVLMSGGFGGFGNNAASQYATRDQVQNGFDTQNLQMQTSGILNAVTNGTAQAVAATNGTFHDTLAVLNDKYGELQRDVAGLAVSQAQLLANQNECCGSTKMLIAEGQASTSAQIAAAKYETAMQMAGMEQRITAKMDANTIQGLRDQVDSLRDQVNMAGVLRFPNSWSYGAGPFPPIFGCGCNGNI